MHTRALSLSIFLSVSLCASFPLRNHISLQLSFFSLFLFRFRFEILLMASQKQKTNNGSSLGDMRRNVHAFEWGWEWEWESMEWWFQCFFFFFDSFFIYYLMRWCWCSFIISLRTNLFSTTLHTYTYAQTLTHTTPHLLHALYSCSLSRLPLVAWLMFSLILSFFFFLSYCCCLLFPS